MNEMNRIIGAYLKDLVAAVDFFFCTNRQIILNKYIEVKINEII